MWKDYSVSYIRNNRASSISLMVAAFISSVFLSLFCCLFYNFWQYDVEQIVLEEGDWQGRIAGTLSDEERAMVENFGNVENVVLSADTVDLYFANPRTIYRDMPLLANELGLEEDVISYHDVLLSRYLIHNPEDESPPLLLPFYLFLLLVIACSLMLIIRNAFAVSMNARIHQFGIFSSIGATPRQIRICLMQEAAALCLTPIMLGSILGIALTYAVLQAANILAADVAGRHDAVFQYHPLIFIATVMVSVLTVTGSAWIPARKLSRLSPMEAIRSAANLPVKKTAMMSLTLSFFAFSLFYNFAAFSRLSVYETSFSKYQDFWDIMVTVKDTSMADFQELDSIAVLENVESPVLYQKAEAYTNLPSTLQSDELMALGGLSSIDGDAVMKDGDYLVKVPIVILDDAGFQEYCRQIGLEPQTGGGIMINRIWDSRNSNFRNRKYVPFVRETEATVSLQNKSGEGLIEVPVIGYTAIEPALWEQYEDYAFVQILPLSFWNTFSDRMESVEADSYLRVLTFDDTDLKEDMAAITDLLGRHHRIEIRNRIQDLETDEQLWQGIYIFMSGGCILLAIIGIANIFSHTMGFVYQRKREFAQYLSIGATPKDMRGILWKEAALTAGKPIAATLPLTAAAMAAIIKASHMEIRQFLPVAPVLPILIYIAALFFFVGLAYYLGGRRLLRGDLSEALRNDTILG